VSKFLYKEILIQFYHLREKLYDKKSVKKNNKKAFM